MFSDKSVYLFANYFSINSGNEFALMQNFEVFLIVEILIKKLKEIRYITRINKLAEIAISKNFIRKIIKNEIVCQVYKKRDIDHIKSLYLYQRSKFVNKTSNMLCK